ncbi:MAG TPA: hypothetical protein VFY75_02040 [Solirubrobacterales bacterium]|nr:hypothetical protein [Solirubrobacterales bacterium]
METLLALDQAGIAVVVIGGWGIDALIGRQLRSHSDLDLVTDERRFDRAVAALQKLGFAPWNHDPAPGPIGELEISSALTLRDRALRVIELHAADLTKLQPARGTIGGNRVACLSADYQLQAQLQMGRTWTPRRRSNRKRNLLAVRGALKRDVNGA